jgi:DNA polymerase/3'-5' exonuclease PolX
VARARVRDVDDLKRAARLGRLAALFEFGELGELKLLEAIAEREAALRSPPLGFVSDQRSHTP